MPLVPGAGQRDLALALCKAAPLLGAQAVVAARAAHAGFIQGRGFVLCAQGVSTGAAELKMARLEVMPHRDPLVKDEALALPGAVALWHLLQVFEDAALEVKHLVKASGAHEGGGFFAADAAGAEHGDYGLFAVFLSQQATGLHLCFHPLRQLGEALSLWVDRAGKSANLELVVVAGVDQHHLGLGDQFVPLLGLHVSARHAVGVYAVDAQGNDLFFQLDLEAIERLMLAP